MLVVADLSLAPTRRREEPSMGGSTGSPMGKTYLSTAVTEDGDPKQMVSNTRIRLEFAEQPNPNEEGRCEPRYS